MPLMKSKCSYSNNCLLKRVVPIHCEMIRLIHKVSKLTAKYIVMSGSCVNFIMFLRYWFCGTISWGVCHRKVLYIWVLILRERVKERKKERKKERDREREINKYINKERKRDTQRERDHKVLFGFAWKKFAREHSSLLCCSVSARGKVVVLNSCFSISLCRKISEKIMKFW